MNFYLSKNGHQTGPHSAAQLNDMLEAEQISGDDYYRLENSDDWKRISEFPGYTPPPQPTPAKAPSTPAGKPALIDRFLGFNFRFGKWFAALMSVIFLLGFIISIIVLVGHMRTPMKVPTYEDIRSSDSTEKKRDSQDLDERRAVEKAYGDKLAEIIKSYDLGSKSYDVLIEDLIGTPKQFRGDYTAGMEDILDDAKSSGEKNQANRPDFADIANDFRREFKYSVRRAELEQMGDKATRWTAMSVAAGCCMATFLMLIIPALLRIEENTRKRAA